MARFLMILLLMRVAPVLAQADPLRPPPGFFTPATSTLREADALVLQGLQRSAGQPRALINGRSLLAGEHIGAWRLLRIDAGSVLLQGPEGRLRLNLLPATNTVVPARNAISSPQPPGGRSE